MSNKIAMPIGIPETTLDFTRDYPEPPGNWDSEVAGYYYIQQDHSEASDSNLFGSIANPRKTIPNPIPAGSLVQVRGLYSYIQGGVFKANSSGTDEDWVAGVSGPVFIDFGLGSMIQGYNEGTNKWIIYGSNFYFQGLKGFACSIGADSDGFSVTNAVIRYCEFIGRETIKATGIAVLAPMSGTSKVNNLVVYKNSAHDFGPLVGSRDLDANGALTNGDVKDIWMLDNHFYNLSGGGIQLSPRTEGIYEKQSRNIYCGRNHIHDCRQAGMGGKYPRDVIISQNVVHDIIDAPWSPSKCIGFQYSPDNIWIIFNTMYNARYGVRGANVSGVESGRPEAGWPMYVIGNIIYNIDKRDEQYAYDEDHTSNSSACVQMAGAYNLLVVNNLIFNSEVALMSPKYSGTLQFYNNVVANMSKRTFFIESPNLAQGAIVNNLVQSKNFRAQIGSVDTTDSAVFEDSSGALSNLFLDVLDSYEGKTDDQIIYEIEHKPLLIDAGNNLPQSVLDIFQTSFGLPFNRGLHDKIIPQGASRDLGPWENGTEFADVLPIAPSDVYIDVIEKSLNWKINSLNEIRIEVYKNGVLLGQVDTGVTSLSVPTICDSVDSYYVTAVSSEGGSNSPVISSRIISANEIQTDELIPDSGSYLLAREDIYREGNLVLHNPSTEGEMLGFSYNDVVVLEGTTAVSKGYIYVNGVSNASIGGVIQGNGNVSVAFITNNFSNEECKFHFKVGDSAVVVTNDSGFTKHVVYFSVNEEDTYNLVSINGNNKSCIGISSIIER